MRIYRFLRLGCAALLALLGLRASAAVHTLWAPGVINPRGGTVELDVIFLRPRSEMLADWRFVAQARGNAPKVGNTTLGVVFCPAGDRRDFTAVATSAGGASNAAAVAPAFVVGVPYRVVLSWGDGACELWFEGRRLARQRFIGELSNLPPFLKLGLEDYFDIRAARISSRPRSAETLSERKPLLQDEETTWFASSDGEGVLSKNTWQREQFRAGVFPDRSTASFTTPVGSGLVVPFRAINFSDADVDFEVLAKVTDRAGRSAGVTRQTLRSPAGNGYVPLTLTLPAIVAPGYHQAEIRITGSNGRATVQHLAFVVRPPDEAPAGSFAAYLGHHHPLGIKPDAFSSLGIRWHRSWAGERNFLWHAIEPAPGNFQWAAADRAVATAEANGIKILGLLGNPPTWASTYSEAERKRVEGKSVKDYTFNPDRYQPRDIEDWKRYVRAVVGRYRGRVTHWEIGNEIDFHPPFLHASFSGSTQDYADLLATAHAVIKEIDPDAQVLTSGFSLLKGVNDAGMPADLMKLGAAAKFDALAVHAYADRSTLAETIDVVRAAKPGVPLWQTEREYMGTPRDDYQAIYSLFWCVERGFSHYFLHEADLDKNFGYLNPTPFYAVTSEVARQLRAADAFVGSVPGAPEGIGSWSLRRTDGRYLNVFAVNNGSVELTFSDFVAGTSVEVTNLYGESLHSGPMSDATLNIENLVYVVCAQPLRVARAHRKPGNLVANPGFELREGDLHMDASAARPSFWVARPRETGVAALRVVAGRSGEFALSVGGVLSAPGAHVVQRVRLDEGGNWRLRAWVRVRQGETVPVKFFLQVGSGRWPGLKDARRIVGDGQWHPMTFDVIVPAGGADGYVLLGVESGTGAVEFDDVDLMPAPP